MTNRTLLTACQPVENYLAHTAASEQTLPITPADIFLLQQFAIYYPAPPFIIDAAAPDTAGASSVMWHIVRDDLAGFTAVNTQWQNPTAETSGWMTTFGEIPSEEILFETPLLDSLESVRALNTKNAPEFLLVSHVSDDAANFEKWLHSFTDRKLPEVIFILPVAKTGTSQLLESTLKFARDSESTFALLREVSPACHSSQVGVLYTNPVFEELLYRLEVLFETNYDYLTLLEENANLHLEIARLNNLDEPRRKELQQAQNIAEAQRREIAYYESRSLPAAIYHAILPKSLRVRMKKARRTFIE